MSSTTFVDQVTPVPASWLNDVNTATYTSSSVPSLTALTSVNGGQLAGLRNRIINGGMQVAQRGNSALVAGYSLDRWFANYTGTQPTWFQVTGATGYSQSASYLQFSGIAANTGISLQQRIESQNSRDLAGQTVTVSYWVNQTTGSSMTVTTNFAYATTTDNFGSTTNIGTPSGTIVPSGVWTKVTATQAIPTAAITGLAVLPLANFPAVLSGQVIQIGNVQLEIGSVATLFEQRPYGMELALCQRYYEAGTGLGSQGLCQTGASLVTLKSYSTVKRSSPTLTYSGTTYTGTSGIATLVSSLDMFIVAVGGTSALGNANFFTNWTASAEL